MNFFETFISFEAVELVNDCMKSRRLSAGKKAAEFEQLLHTVFGLENVVTVNSGTSALHLALVLAGVQTGDEVILPAQTFIATGEAVLYVGAKPVFCDIDPRDGCISIDSVKTKITGKTKAIMCVDWAGYPCDLEELMAIGKIYGIPIIEDAAHSIGATYKHRQVGCIADYTCFSFQAIKHLTTGDGGAICCKNLKDVLKARNLRWFDIDRDHSNADILGERVYDAQHVGYKYHMNDFSACMGLGNLPYIKNNLLKVREIAACYDKAFGEIEKIQLMDYKSDRTSSYWLYPMLVKDRERFIAKLKDKGIPASVVHLGIDKYSIFGGKKTLRGQREFDANQIHIPINYNLTFNEVELIIDTVRGGW